MGNNETIIKDIYTEVGTNFRHFLAWRRFLFAGYFAVLAGLFQYYNWETARTSYTNRGVLIVAIFVSLIFWLLDLRNRKLIRNVSDAGVNLERKLGLSEEGSYSIYKNEEHKLTHSRILTIFYIFAILWFLFMMF